MTHPATFIRSIDDLPIALTVSETAAVLRVGKNKVYELVHQWHSTGGADGLRSVRLGRALRIPRLAVLEFLGIVEGQTDIQVTFGDVHELHSEA